MKIAFTITEDLFKSLNEYCRKYGYNRSELIRDCIRDRLFKKTNNYETDKQREN